MPVDPSIPLSFKPTEFPAFSAENRIRLQSLVEQTQLRQLQIEEQRKQMQQQSAVEGVYRNPAYFKDGMISLEGIRALDMAAPGTGQKALITQQNEAFRKTQDDQAKAALAEHRTKTMNEIRDKAVSMTTPFAEQMKSNPGLVNRKAKENYQNTFDEYRRSGRLVGIPEQEWDNLRNHDFDFYSMQSQALGAEKAVTVPKKLEEQESKMAARESAADARDKNAELREREFKFQQDQAKAKAEAKAAAEGSRAEVFTNRIVTSANEAMRSLKNVVQLPIASSSGWLAGRGQPHSILGATKDVLANKVTAENVQIYNTMASGIQRNLATIEAVGLMPSGSLTHQMDAVIIKEGDTELTKATKLAEIRQIIEAGLEPVLANPRVEKEKKDFVRGLIDQVAKAVPYTQQDVINVMTSTNPGATLGDAIKRQSAKAPPVKAGPKGAKTGVDGGAVKPYDDPEKEKRYQEWKRRNGY